MTDGWILLGIVLVGLAVRLPNLNDSFFGDEGYSILVDSNTIYTHSIDRFRPVFFTLLYLWRQIGFEGEAGLRALSLMFGFAQIPLAFLLGRRLESPRLGLALGGMVALSPLLIEFSQELRPYAVFTAAAIANAWLLLRFLEKPNLSRGGAFILVGAFGTYTHMFYWLYLMGMAFTFLRARREVPLWKGIAVLGSVLLLYLPNYPNIVYKMVTDRAEFPLHLPSAIPKLVAAFTVGFNYFTLGDQPNLRPVGMGDLLSNGLLTLLAAALAALILWGIVRRHRREGRTPSLWIAHELFSIPVGMALLLCVVTNKYWIQPKYVIFAAPFALLMMALGYFELPRRWLRWLTAGLGTLVAVIALLHFWDNEHYGRREDWRGAVAYVKPRLSASTEFYVLSIHHLLPYYWSDQPPPWTVARLPEGPSITAEYLDGLRADLEGKTDVYYLWYDIWQNIYDPRDLLTKALDQLSAHRESKVFNPRLKVYHWELLPIPPQPKFAAMTDATPF